MKINLLKYKIEIKIKKRKKNDNNNMDTNMRVANKRTNKTDKIDEQLIMFSNYIKQMEQEKIKGETTCK